MILIQPNSKGKQINTILDKSVAAGRIIAKISNHIKRAK